jgi:hypothetical protein
VQALLRLRGGGESTYRHWNIVSPTAREGPTAVFALGVNILQAIAAMMPMAMTLVVMMVRVMVVSVARVASPRRIYMMIAAITVSPMPLDR